ncbi:hypothetical protein C9I94_16925 [Photobacterium swingsii]|uniref:O-antigen polymerase n=2 Tax=Photobacterium swingsii TaxID=680026 RepID=A0A2T3P453_9GAMM|nr:hypothetical protein [Photobacterium swingsii]PSW23302.1 hypothetical protein C9I94_16925 [Photobacterium swingsii]
MAKRLLVIYLFLFVFSLTIPIFYHSAFLVGFISFVHLITVSNFNYRHVSKYVGSFLFLTGIGYILVIFISIYYETYDFSFLKTYTNNFLSSLCAIPLAQLFVLYYKKDAYDQICKSLFYVFFIQSLIIIVVLLLPFLKPIVQVFHRNAELAMQADVFSSGIRTNALSGGLFFGLTISFSIALIIYFHYYMNQPIKRILAKDFAKFSIVNIGMLISGRFGAVYLFSLLFMKLFSLRVLSKLRTVFLWSFLTIIFAVFYVSIFSVDLSFLYENNISTYVLEFIENGAESQSTNRLLEMYQVNFPLADVLLGTGHYTNLDGSYYQHIDVGYFRVLLFGGIPFLLFSILFTLNLLSPILKANNIPSAKSLWMSLVVFFFLSSFKGEVMVTMVSVNSTLFLFCLIISLTNKKFYHEPNAVT